MLPITRLRHIDGANGRNWPGYVILDPEAPHRAAVWAQEAWEAMHKLNPLNLLKTRLSARHRRRMEIMGHEVEVQVAVLVYGEDEGEYRSDEAARMLRGYDGLFADFTHDTLMVRMASRRAEANRWVRRNIKKIERWKE